MQSIHLICKPEGAGLKGLSHDRSSGTSRSGQWDIAEETALGLVGGWLYLHQTKNAPSQTGGRILACEMVEDAALVHGRRVVFTFRPALEGRNQKWRGRSHTMAHSSHPVPATLPHEADP